MKISLSDPGILNPKRPKIRYRPLQALSGMRKLIQDKEDTSQVFRVMDALNGDFTLKDLRRFAQTKNGEARIRERKALPPILDDHDRLKRYPSGSVAEAYVTFMEAEGLSAKGLVEESERYYGEGYDDLVQWFEDRKRDMHDLFHVLTGYGRDPLGEAALLAFSYGQDRGGLGVIFTAYMSCRELKSILPSSVDVMACFREGRENGHAACELIGESVVHLLSEPLEDARQRLCIQSPKLYLETVERLGQSGVDIYDVLS